jgi:uncharacterized protein YegL
VTFVASDHVAILDGHLVEQFNRRVHMGFASSQEDIISRWVNAAPLDESSRKPRRSVPATSTASVGHENEERKMGKLKDFTVSSARPLPVIVLADVSASMAAEGKIDALNLAMTEMLAAFAEEASDLADICVAVITIGGEASLHIPITPAREVKWSAMPAHGRTPLGAALDLVTNLVEDRQILSSRAYRPTLVLVSDGLPTDEWQSPLARQLAAERTKKAQRLALAIGADADHDVLRAFLADPEGRVFQAHEAREIRKFFRWVTMSVTSRSRSIRPNEVIDIPPLDLEDYADF